MGIIGSIIGRREPLVEYRTVDGGHRAPFPDMTDEQLYNYEITFNVPKRTFDRPPSSIRRTVEEPVMHSEAQARPEVKPNVKPNMQANPRPQSQARTQTNPQPDPHQAPQPRWRQKTFNAPRYTARKSGPEAAKQVQTEPGTPMPIDFSKPVRIITNKQPVDIITTRARHPIYKVHGYIGNDDVVTVFTLDGRLSENGPCFLENVPQKQQLHLNIYANRKQPAGEPYLITQHATRKEADAAARADRLACIEVQLDC